MLTNRNQPMGPILSLLDATVLMPEVLSVFPIGFCRMNNLVALPEGHY
jgi:hypothetical protein